MVCDSKLYFLSQGFYNPGILQIMRSCLALRLISLCTARKHSRDAVARSSTEAEFMAAVNCAKAVKCFRSILDELGVKQVGPTKLYGDNVACCHLANAGKPTERARHTSTSSISPSRSGPPARSCLWITFREGSISPTLSPKLWGQSFNTVIAPA